MDLPQLIVHGRFLDALRKLTPEELSQLEANIEAVGCTDPIIVWQWQGEANIIIDGHNRYRICRALNIPFTVKALFFESEDAVIEFIKQRHRGRRNLAENELAYLRGKKYEELKGPRGGDQKSKGHAVPSIVAEVVAAQSDVDPRTVKRDAQFAKAVDTIAADEPDAKPSLLDGSISKAEVKRIAAMPSVARKAALSAGKTKPKRKTKTVKTVSELRKQANACAAAIDELASVIEASVEKSDHKTEARKKLRLARSLVVQAAKLL